MPPSVNAAYRNVPGRGRVKSKKYLAWYKEAVVMLRRQRPTPCLGADVLVGLMFGPRNRRRDLDNMIKLPLDLLVSEGLISDDSRVVKISAEWGEGVKGCTIVYVGMP